jgi:hypothetical protein
MTGRYQNSFLKRVLRDKHALIVLVFVLGWILLNLEDDDEHSICLSSLLMP